MRAKPHMTHHTERCIEVRPYIYLTNWNLSVPFICQLRTTIKSNPSAILKSFAGKNMLHYLVFFLCINTDGVNSVLYTEILNQRNCFS